MHTGGIFFVLYDILTNGLSYFLRLAVSAGFIFLFVYALFRLGTFGGADAKSLIALSIILPVYPRFQIFGYSFPLNKPMIDLFAFGILGNAVTLTTVVPAGLFVLNLARKDVRIKELAFALIGYKCKISELGDKHIKFIQDFELISDTVKFHFKLGGVEINEKKIQILRDMVDRGLIKDEIWVTPSFPFMIPITAGFFTAALYGDLIFELTKLFF